MNKHPYNIRLLFATCKGVTDWQSHIGRGFCRGKQKRGNAAPLELYRLYLATAQPEIKGGMGGNMKARRRRCALCSGGGNIGIIFKILR